MTKKQGYFHDLYQVAMAINSAGTAESILSSTVQATTKALNAKGSSIMLLTPDKKSLIHTISYGLSDAFTKKGPRSVAKSLPETLSGKGKVSIVSDVAKESRRVHFPEEAKKEGIVSILAVPMKLKGNTIGELRVYTAEKRKFSQDDIDFVQAVANLGALALDNARLYEATQKAYKELAQDVLTFRYW